MLRIRALNVRGDKPNGLSPEITLTSQEEPPLRFAAGADAVATLEHKGRDLLAQAHAHRELSSSLAHKDT